MILSGKDLIIYRMNKIAKFSLMVASSLTFTAFMMLVWIAYN